MSLDLNIASIEERQRGADSDETHANAKGRPAMKDSLESAGPDYYFEKALQYPELPSSSSPSSSPLHTTRKFVLLPSSIKNEKYLTYLSSPAVNKDLRYHSPANSPGSNATSKTSECTDDDYENEVDDDLDSHCGSLAYSVESWALGHFHSEEIDAGYNAEDEDDLVRSSHILDNHNDNHDCFIGDTCFLRLDWVRMLVQESFQKLESLFPQLGL
jgi:hypothetical protein